MSACPPFVLAFFLLAPSSGETPPGLVPVAGGKTRIGTPVAEVEEWIRAHEELHQALPAETPQFTRAVDDFALMPTEVTNEQYRAFVQATGARPPRSWGAAALRAGQEAFLAEQAQARQRARAASTGFAPATFDPEAWWCAHWHESSWAVPEGELDHPVVFVTYAEAQRYARWAGLRLMSEFEFQRAGRGDGSRTYPWGDQWDDRRYCRSLHAGEEASAAVGAYPAGAAQGVFDLCGNVWEWTASPCEPYPGHRPLRIPVRGRERAIEGLAPFDSEQRVVVGGSFQMDELGVRLSVRKFTDPNQATSALGFRCAASPTPGLDAARWLLEEELAPPLAAPFCDGLAFAPGATRIRRRWSTDASAVAVPGYALITGYAHVLVCPRTSLPYATVADLAERSRVQGPLVLGFLDLPGPSSSPALARGPLYVAWRAAGALEGVRGTTQGLVLGPQEARARAFYELPGFRAERDCFVFLDARGAALATVPAEPCRLLKRSRGALELRPSTGDGPQHVWLELAVPARTSGKSFTWELELEFPAGTFDASWR